MEPTFNYDIQGFAADLGLTLADIANLYAEFIQEIDVETGELKTLLAAKDWNAMKKIIHNIKGLSVNYRILDLHEKAVRIYHALQSGDYHEMESNLEDLLTVAAGAAIKIRNFFAEQHCDF